VAANRAFASSLKYMNFIYFLEIKLIFGPLVDFELNFKNYNLWLKTFKKLSLKRICMERELF
jgi:hypothetical protein